MEAGLRVAAFAVEQLDKAAVSARPLSQAASVALPLSAMDFMAAASQPTVFTATDSTVDSAGELSRGVRSAPDYMDRTPITATTIIRTTPTTTPIMTMAAAILFSGACTPGTAGAFGRSRSAADAVIWGDWKNVDCSQLKLRTADGGKNPAASVYSATRPFS